MNETAIFSDYSELKKINFNWILLGNLREIKYETTLIITLQKVFEISKEELWLVNYEQQNWYRQENWGVTKQNSSRFNSRSYVDNQVGSLWMTKQNSSRFNSWSYVDNQVVKEFIGFGIFSRLKIIYIYLSATFRSVDQRRALRRATKRLWRDPSSLIGWTRLES